MGGAIVDPAQFPAFVLIAGIAFPAINLIVRAFKGKRTSVGHVILMITLGASAPVSLFLALSLVDKTLLTQISDQNVILAVTGLTGLALCAYQLFDVDI